MYFVLLSKSVSDFQTEKVCLTDKKRPRMNESYTVLDSLTSSFRSFQEVSLRNQADDCDTEPEGLIEEQKRNSETERRTEK